VTKRLDYNQIAPNGTKALGGIYGYVIQSRLPAELAELVYLHVSQFNSCAYWLDMHTRDLIKKGVPIEKLALVQAWQEGGNLFSEAERAALAWTETVTRVAQTSVPDEAYQAARAVFGEKELVDLWAPSVARFRPHLCPEWPFVARLSTGEARPNVVKSQVARVRLETEPA
jgi:AhpD family alkylhydroperoxidase